MLHQSSTSALLRWVASPCNSDTTVASKANWHPPNRVNLLQQPPIDVHRCGQTTVSVDVLNRRGKLLPPMLWLTGLWLHGQHPLDATLPPKLPTMVLAPHHLSIGPRILELPSNKCPGVRVANPPKIEWAMWGCLFCTISKQSAQRTSLMLHPLPILQGSKAWRPTPKCAGGCHTFGESAPNTCSRSTVNSRGTVRNQQLALEAAQNVNKSHATCTSSTCGIRSVRLTSGPTHWQQSQGVRLGHQGLSDLAFQWAMTDLLSTPWPLDFSFCAALVRASATPGFRPSAFHNSVFPK